MAGLGRGQRTIGSSRGSFGGGGPARGGRRGRDTAGGGCTPKLLFPPLGQRRILHALQEETLALAPVERLLEGRG